MIATFRETWTSVRNLNYGQEIIKKTVGQAFWYWWKYVLLLAAVIGALVIAALTYFIPQTPKWADRFLPDISVVIKDGLLATNATQPLTLSGAGFTFIVNTQGSPEDIANIDVGVLVLKDRLIFKDQTQTQSLNFSEVKEEVRLDKSSLVDWLMTHKLTLLVTTVGVVIFTALIGVGFYTLWQVATLVIGAGGLWIMSRLLHRGLTFVNTLKLAVYAAVPALLISTLFFLTPHPSRSLINLTVWAFFACIWLIKLPQST